MADNTTLNTGTGGDIISTDVITTLNGVGIVTGEKAQRVKVGWGVDATFNDVTAAAPLPVVMPGNALVSAVNSSTANLGAGAVFTGTAEDVSDFSTIMVSIFSSHVSAVDGLMLQQSSDGANWDNGDLYTIPATTGKVFSAPVQQKFFRIVYTNGATLTTSLRIQALYSRQAKNANAVRPQDGRSNENDFGEDLSFLMAYNGVTWDRLRSSIANGLAVDVTRIGTGTNRIGAVQVTGGPNSQVLGLGSTVSPYGYVRATIESTSLFYDPFDGAVIDVTNRWNSPTVTGMTVSQASGALTIGTTTTNSNSAFIDTQPAFLSEGLNFKIFGAAVKVEAQTVNLFALNQHRFFGFGDRPGAFAAATPLGNAIGFEIFTDGKLYACVYSAGTRIFNSAVDLLGNTLNSLVVPSTGYFRVSIEMRADGIFWYIGTTEYPAVKYDVSTASFSLPALQALPLRIHAVNATAGTVGTSVLSFLSIGVADSGGNSTHINDGTSHWRKASVGKNGGLSIKGSAVAAQTTNFAATITGNTTGYDVTEAGNISFIVKNTIAGTGAAWTGSPVIVFEQSDDNVSWSPLAVTRGDTLQTNTTFTLAALGTNVEAFFNAAAPGLSFVRARVTTGTATNSMTIVVLGGGLLYAPQVSTQDRKDAGRTPFCWFAEAVAGVTGEALITMTAAIAAGTAGASGTTYNVPAGKTLRLTSMTISFVSTTTTANTTKIRLRALASGAAIVTSPILWSAPRVGWSSATFVANQSQTQLIDLPDGFELAAGNSLALTHIEAAVNGTIDVMVTGFLY